MVNMVIDDTIGGGDVRILKSFIIIDKTFTIQKFGNSEIKHIYVLNEANGKFKKLSSTNRIAKV